jgi:beta-lactamase class C
MGRFRWTCLCILAAAGNATAATAGKNVDADIRQAVQAFMREYKIPGVAMAITVNGKEQFYDYGVASRATQVPVTSDTLFEIGSVSKTFTATLASYAQVNRQLSLDDHPGKYLPELQGTDFDAVTLLNLGTHTAGGFPLQVPEEIQDNTQLMAYFRAWKPQYAAGSQRTYANPSVGMLGLITARSMRMPFDAAMENVLLPKLGLSNTYLHVPADKMARYAQGYNSKDQPVRVNPGMLWEEAYGIKTNAKDLLRFVEINLGLVEVEPKLKQAIADTHIGYFKLSAMTQDLIWEQFAYPVSEHDFLEASSDKVVLQNNVVAPWHPPRAPQQDALINKTGSTAGFGAYVAFIPSKKIGIVLLTNHSHPMDGRLRLVYRILGLLDTASR